MPTHARATMSPAPVRASGGRAAPVRRSCKECDEEIVRRRAALPGTVTDAPRMSRDFSLARIPIYSAEEVARWATEAPAPIGPGGGPLPDGLGSYLARSAGSGRALDAPVQARLEASFGRALAGVRVIADEAAAGAADALRARAFTVGQSIWFGRGEYRPGTRDGDHLLAHEVAHTVQAASAGRPMRADLVVGGARDPAEAEADRAADAAVRGDVVELAALPTPTHVARQSKPAADPSRATLAAEQEIAEAMQTARAIHKRADAIVAGASQVELDLVDIVQAQGEAVEDTLTRVTDSSLLIAGLPEDQRRVILGAAAVELPRRGRRRAPALRPQRGAPRRARQERVARDPGQRHQRGRRGGRAVPVRDLARGMDHPELLVAELAGDLVALGTGAVE